MAWKKYLSVILSCIVLLGAQNYSTKIYEGFISNNMQLWQRTIDEMQKAKHITLELINYQYGYIAWCIANDKISEGRKMLELANENLEMYFSNREKSAEYFAYKSAFLGYEIGLDKYKAPFVAKKSQEYLNKALFLDPNNYFVYLQKGHADFYKPSIVGGSKTRAIEYYKKALILYEKNYYNKKDWNYLALITDLIKAYMDINNYSEAKIYAEKALKVEPNYKWVKEDLYPEILKNLKK